MKPFDFASRIIPIDLVGGNFVVSLADARWRLAIRMSPSSSAADHTALIARQIVARGMAQAMEESLCWAAAEIDDAYFKRAIVYADHGADLCRKLAKRFHLEELNKT